MTNEEFAAKVGIHFSMASRLRTGKRLPSAKVLRRISKTFKLSAAELLDAHNRGPEEFSQYLNTHVSFDNEPTKAA